ncbi:MAG: ribonuclease R [Flavobacteriaceae bacterium]
MSKKKKNTKQIQRKLHRHFRENPTKTYNYKQLAAHLNLMSTQDRNAIIRCLHLLKLEKVLIEKKKGAYQWKENSQQLEKGSLEITGSGNGFVVMDQGDDIFIARKNLNGAFHGDSVTVYPFKRGRKGKNEGEVVAIVERYKTHFIGTLQRQKDFGFVLTQGSRMYTDFFIPSEYLHDFNDGDRVEVEFIDWPKRASSPHGKIVRSLGKPGELDTEMHSILLDFNLPIRFKEDIEAAARSIPTTISSQEINKRKDFRDCLTFTIDPKTAKDFDDALSFKKISKDLYEIGIHIADVSHYVDEESIIDEEAYQRGTSVYLVDRVVPMLPENLSNGLCSLRPNEEKLTYSAVFHIDKQGRITKEWFGRTVICSNHRFAYEEVQYLIETEGLEIPATISLSQQAYTISKEVYESIIELNRLAQGFRSRRLHQGAISFDRKEIQFQLDSDNQPQSVFFKESKAAHQLIEEFMLLANRSVATFIGKQKPIKHFVYRVHDEPDIDKLDNLQMIVASFGYPFNPQAKHLNKEINKLLHDSHGKKEQNMIDTLTLRCMSKALYTTDNIGHYGLGFEYYSHFTSPIRRYPDVLVHRLLTFYLEGGTHVNVDLLEEACLHASQREQLATKAERESIKYMQVKFMEDKIGLAFEGIISGVTERGVYVEINSNKCEGMINVKDLAGDYFYYDDEQHAMIGQRSLKEYRLGDPIKIEVKSANLTKRQLDFVLAVNN